MAQAKKVREVKFEGQLAYVVYEVPKEFLKQFLPHDVEYITDEFEELLLLDIAQFDTDTLKKISRDVTQTLKNWIDNKIRKKENVSLNAKGSTRSGKSLAMLSLNDTILSNYDNKEFDTVKIVCANQKEYRQQLRTADFGDCFQIDENAFAHVGLGSVTEMQQLKDIQNIIAKKNIHTTYITPRVFLETNASLGLSTWGKDSKNWLTRFLLYDLRNRTTPLMGYVVIDVGKLFRKYGCYIYKFTGGCTNPMKLSESDLDKDAIKYSDCIPKNYKKEDLIKTNLTCPFYNMCKHPLNRYEKKKDTWIKREMEGGLDERTFERYSTGLQLFQKVSTVNEEGKIMLIARDSKQLKIKINLYVPTITSTKYTQAEVDEIISLIKGLTNLTFFKEICSNLKLDFKEELGKIENSKIILENLDKK